MNPDDAKEQMNKWRLAKRHHDNSVDHLMADIKKLPIKLQKIIAGFYQLDSNLKYTRHEEHFWFSDDPIEAFLHLSAPSRDKLLSALIGSALAKDIETLIKWDKAQPQSFLDSHGYSYAESFRVGRWLKPLFDLIRYEKKVLSSEWLAQWSSYLEYGYGNRFGRLFAALIDQGGTKGEQIFNILCQAVRSEHEIAVTTNDVLHGLMQSNNEAGWELIEGLLLAAQRQEGLRQSILEVTGHAHPKAFKRMLNVIVDNDLTRFSSIVKVFDGWFGMQWSVLDKKRIKRDLEFLVATCKSPSSLKKALADADAANVYLALRVQAIESIEEALKSANKLGKHKSPEHRFVAALFVSTFTNEQALKIRIAMSKDKELRVALQAISGIYYDLKDSESIDKQVFDALLNLSERLPEKSKPLEAMVWPWTQTNAGSDSVINQLPRFLGKRSVTELVPYMSAMAPDTRGHICRLYQDRKNWDSSERTLILDLAGDVSNYVRQQAFSQMEDYGFTPTAEEQEKLQNLLTRKTADLRIQVMNLLVRCEDADTLGTARVLVESKNKNQKLAGLEIARLLVENQRCVEDCLELGTLYQKSKKKITAEEQVQLDAILAGEQSEITLENCLGLIDESEITPVVPPKKHDVTAVTPAALNLIKSLDEFLYENRELEVTVESFRRTETTLLGEVRFLSTPVYNAPAKAQRKRFSAIPLLEKWYKKIPASCKDKDNMHLLRALALMQITQDRNFNIFTKFGEKGKSQKQINTFLVGKTKLPVLKSMRILASCLNWLLYLNPPQSANSYAINMAETVFAMIPDSDRQLLTTLPDPNEPYDHYLNDFRHIDAFNCWLRCAKRLNRHSKLKPKLKDKRRLWDLEVWLDKPVPGASRKRPDTYDLATAFENGWISTTDIYDQIIGPHADDRFFSNLSELTKRVPISQSLKDFSTNPEIVELLTKIVDRLFELEINRGESDTEASRAIVNVTAFYGVDRLILLLAALGDAGLASVSHWDRPKDNRKATFSKLIKKFYPSAEETPESFTKKMKSAIKAGHFTQERLLQLAFFAPQWRKHVGHTLGWDGFSEAMYWFMAHMKYIGGVDDALLSDEELKQDKGLKDGGAEKLSKWGQIVRERTPLTAQDRYDGAIDVSWFRTAYDLVTPKQWSAISSAAKFAATGPQAKRAQLVADVLVGKASKKGLVEGIKKRHLKENVRLLGLLPLAKGAKLDNDLHDRYETLQNYKQYANKLSSMARPEAIKAYEVGMQNLASTAAYPDAMRLQWSLEAKATADLNDGPVIVEKADVRLALTLDEDAQPELLITRADKQIKSIPKTLAKDKNVLALKERYKHLTPQVARIKTSLEQAMCRCDELTGDELAKLSEHALLWPQLRRLVLISDNAIGYPAKKGKALRDSQGEFKTVKKKDRLRIAHPYDLMKTKKWSHWQKECLTNNQRQPFKQIFRELYVVTSQEKKDKDHSNRYAGHQVNRHQSFALWGQRGWSRDEYENIWKPIYNVPINVEVNIEHGYDTPLEVEGLTIDKIQFVNRGNSKPTNLKDLPPVLFSEVMRDMDLVVSVAHVGDVDPEASASTVEMRAALLKETCQLLGLKNVTIKIDRAIIKGKLGEYTVHLGSAVVHKLPGGSVCLVAVPSQDRGRIFLPFADDDPRTAEIISKVVMLANDKDIKDPVLLQQLR